MRAFSYQDIIFFVSKFYNDIFLTTEKVNYTETDITFFIRGSVDEIVSPKEQYSYLNIYIKKNIPVMRKEFTAMN